MKKFKQIFSLILAVLMLITVVPLQSFAAFDFLYPTVESIEYAGEIQPISYKGVLSDKWSEDDEYVSLLDLNKYDVTLSNGKVIENTSFATSIINRISSISFSESVKIADCKKAIVQGKSTVDVQVTVFVNYINYKYNYFTFTLQRPIVEEIVKNISFVDTLPEVTEDTYYNANFDFVGKKFEIEYADGTKKTATVEETEYSFLLDGKDISVIYDDNYYIDDATQQKVYYTGYTVEFVDAVTILDKKIHECNYSALEMLDYSFNDDGKLTSIKYRLTHNDGSKIEKTCSFDPLGADEKIVIDTVDGYDIVADLYVSPSFFSQNSFSFVTISYGIGSWELRASDTIFDFTEICDCRCHKSGIIYIFNQIVFKLQEIFGKETECKCGAWHEAIS